MHFFWRGRAVAHIGTAACWTDQDANGGINLVRTGFGVSPYRQNACQRSIHFVTLLPVGVCCRSRSRRVLATWVLRMCLPFVCACISAPLWLWTSNGAALPVDALVWRQAKDACCSRNVYHRRHPPTPTVAVLRAAYALRCTVRVRRRIPPSPGLGWACPRFISAICRQRIPLFVQPLGSILRFAGAGLWAAVYHLLFR